MPPRDFHDSDAKYNQYLKTFADWVTAKGGWAATNYLRFTAEGNAQRAVVLTGMRVEVAERVPLTTGTAFTFAECGSLLAPRPFSIGLDETPPRLWALPGETVNAAGDTADSKPATFPFTVTPTDPEVFDLSVADGRACDCRWRLSLSYVADGHTYSTVLDDAGQPFHGVPRDPVPTYTLINGYLERKRDSSTGH